MKKWCDFLPNVSGAPGLNLNGWCQQLSWSIWERLSQRLKGDKWEHHREAAENIWEPGPRGQCRIFWYSRVRSTSWFWVGFPVITTRQGSLMGSPHLRIWYGKTPGRQSTCTLTSRLEQFSEPLLSAFLWDGTPLSPTIMTVRSKT